MRPVNSLIGAPIERVEDLRFLRGRGIYVGDLRRDNVVHAVILRSSVAHGLIRSIDVKVALAMPGVHMPSSPPPKSAGRCRGFRSAWSRIRPMCRSSSR